MRAFLKTSVILLSVYALLPATTAIACSRGIGFSFNEVFAADVIVRATAVKYFVEPDPIFRTTGVPDSLVEFDVKEILKGEGVPENILLNAYLTGDDDFNENPVPYKFVRRGGRAGSCFANGYKEGAQFLLFLKKTANGYTSNISALGPTNEQLRSETDPWLLWVKVRLNPCGKLHQEDAFYEDMIAGTLYDDWQNKMSSVKYRALKCYLKKYETKDGPDDQYLKYIKRWVEKYERDEERK